MTKRRQEGEELLIDKSTVASAEDPSMVEEEKESSSAVATSAATPTRQLKEQFAGESAGSMHGCVLVSCHTGRNHTLTPIMHVEKEFIVARNISLIENGFRCRLTGRGEKAEEDRADEWETAPIQLPIWWGFSREAKLPSELMWLFN